MTLDLLLGTGNAAKIGRLAGMVAGLPIRVLTPADVGAGPAISEGTVSLEENAAFKARGWARRFGVAVLSTDGGLNVPALGASWNPVLTARAAGAGADDRARALHLLRLAAHLQGVERTVQRLEAVALASAHGQTAGVWLARDRPHRLACTYEPEGVPFGFWIPGLLMFDGNRRYGQLTSDERAAADEHWIRLTPPVRAAVMQLAGAAQYAP